ncbi:MAG: hypothetical protein ACYDCO_18605 [Armatimonadota bacterium]
MPTIHLFANSTHHLGLMLGGTVLPATHHEAIDDPIGWLDDEQDYVLKPPTGGSNYATFGWDNPIPAGSEIHSVSVTCRVSLGNLESAAGQAAVLEIGTQPYYQYGLPGYGGWTTTTKTWLQHPANRDWTCDDLQHLSFGVQLSAIEGADAPSRCTQCYLTIDYTPAAGTFRPHGCVC